MKRYYPLITIGVILLFLSGILYFAHYLIFGDVHHIFIYLLGDLAFLPLEVFLVMVVIERVLAQREKQAMLQKLNMVIGAFFSEVGNYLLINLTRAFEQGDEISKALDIKQDWKHGNFKKAVNFASKLSNSLDSMLINMEELKSFLVQKRTFLLRLLENPNLLEHERFTDLLWATFHLTEELEARQSLQGLPHADIKHICNDILRVYTNLTQDWLLYAEHLRDNYPYLYSLVIRTHPFQPHPSATIQD